MKRKTRYSKKIKRIAQSLLFIHLVQVFNPTSLFALTSGPSQPEMQSFEPVGTTNLVNLQTGDFDYNIPLLDVEGYPINIAYHGGINVEQEASWVGLGWNINPGCINRNVRGVPDDFNGDEIEKVVKINKEVTANFNVSAPPEVFGADIGEALNSIGIKGDISFGMSNSNYSGLSASLTPVSFSFGNPLAKDVSPGLNLSFGVSTDKGADIDYSLSLSKAFGPGRALKIGFGQHFNSSQGLMQNSFNTSAVSQRAYNGQKFNGNAALSNNSWTPIALENFVPVITNAYVNASSYVQLRSGAELYGAYFDLTIGIGASTSSIEQNGNRKAYGYFNLENASYDDIKDFSRDRDGRFHRRMRNLAPASMTYDIFSVTAQGTGGSFRGFRDDIGSVNDPNTIGKGSSNSGLVDIGAANLFEGGLDFTDSRNTSRSGPWSSQNIPFSSKSGLHEPYYMKQAGELSAANDNFKTKIDGYKKLRYTDYQNIKSTPYTNNSRVARSNLMYFFNGNEASHPGTSLSPELESYGPLPATNGNVTKFSRTGQYRKGHHVSEVVQLLPDGRRYIYGIPAMNISQKEYMLSVNTGGTYPSSGKTSITYSGGEPVEANASDYFGQKMFVKTTTPSNAHSYLLTSVLSSDYVDMTGDGISDDDLGNYTKLNYTLVTDKYVWRSPYKQDEVKLDIGVRSDCHDDKGSYVVGQKEVWHVQSIETKNFIAEFYISPRVDGAGADNGQFSAAVSKAPSFKLDKIVLYNKLDRKQNGSNAKVIKEVQFTYDYSLCKGIPNHQSVSGSNPVGKLTLKAIAIKSGSSDIGLLSPYLFEYGNGTNAANPNYDENVKDVWGSFKPISGNSKGGFLDFSNWEYSYVNQNDPDLDKYAGAWNLSKVHLPSGGTIEVEYEMDDYAYVQDKRAMEMVEILGCGQSKNYNTGHNLYQEGTNPFLYLYFNKSANELYNDLRTTYLGDDPAIMFNVEVNINKGQKTPSCGIDLVDNIKGYADVEEIGTCAGDPTKGYIKLKPKYMDKGGGFIGAITGLDQKKLILNPITAAALNYERYYNNKSLTPESELTNFDPVALVKSFAKAFEQYADYIRSPYVKYLNKGMARDFNLGRSYIRLYSQGKKKGGGNRVKEIKYSDAWNEFVNGSPYAVYGSKYTYTTLDPLSGEEISSGVASYEPLLGGDENPFRRQLLIDRVGNDNNFPMVDPIELINESPIGEAFYPPASVIYSKVSVSSIHKDQGRSSQLLQEHEYYTAKDFPVKFEETELQEIENKEFPKLSLKSHQQSIFRAAQGYVLSLNDMAGKEKQSSIYIDNNGQKQLVSYKKYEYFTNARNASELDNHVNTLSMQPDLLSSNNGGNKKMEKKELGVEVDFTSDTREKIDINSTSGLMLNMNLFTFGIIPIPVPTFFPRLDKQKDQIFSSLVTTKIIQRYGILKSVETFDKGSTVKLTNDLFDGITGEVLLTKVNTEHNDFEYNFKTPAYWAYAGMGPAFENINYEKHVQASANEGMSVVNDIVYLYTDDLDKFEVGDEVIADIYNACILTGNQKIENPHSYKMWVIDKDNEMETLPLANVASTNPALANCIGGGLCPSSSNEGLTYDFHAECSNHNKVRIDYDTWISSPNYSRDYICKVPYSNLFSDNNDFNISSSVNNYSGTSNTKLNELLDIAFSSSTMTTPMQDLKNLVRGDGSTIKPYPLDYYVLDPLHMADYQCGTNDPPIFALNDPICLSTTPASTDCSLFPYFNTNTALQQYSFYKDRRQHSHDQTKSQKFFLRATLNDLSAYNTFYGSNAIPFGQSQKLMKVSVHIMDKVDLTVSDASGSKIFHVQDPTKPNNKKLNNYMDRVLEFYFPIPSGGLGANAQLQSAYNSLNVPNLTLLANLPLYVPFGMPVYFPHEYTTGAIVCCKKTDPGHIHDINGSTGCNLCCYIQSPINGHLKSGTNISKSVSLYYTSKVEIVDREQTELIKTKRSAVKLKLQKRQMQAYNGTITSTSRWNGVAFPSNDSIKEAKIRIIRSGKRNQLGESVEQVSTLENPVDAGKIVNFNKVTNIGATTYSNKGYAPIEAAEPGGEWYNEYITGLMSSYKPEQVYAHYRNRSTNQFDKVNGVLTGGSVGSFWGVKYVTYGNGVNDPYLKIKVDLNNSNWQAKSSVVKYDAWGNDAEVKDASGSIHCNLFGYGHKMPTAIVSNSTADNSFNENIEDFKDMGNWFQYIKGVFQYAQNQFRKSVLSDIVANSNTNYEVDAALSHTGKYSLKIKNLMNIAMDVMPEKFNASNPNKNRELSTFYFRPGEQYLLSYWQYGDANSIPGNVGKIKLQLGSTLLTFKAKTPNIDGWIQYEGKFTVPQNTTQATLIILAMSQIDDIRLLPYLSNMKSYVYHPESQKLVAVMDENNMATRFEYSAEGKLQRIKKETEKGVLTLKESRESLRNIISPPVGTSWPAWTDPSSTFGTPVITIPYAPFPLTNQ